MFISCIDILVHSFNETPLFLVGGISLRANCHVKCKFAALKVAVNNFLEFRVYFLTNVAITYHSRIDITITKWLLKLLSLFYHTQEALSLLLVAIG